MSLYSGRRGYILVTVLFISMILFIMGLGFLSVRALQYQEGSKISSSDQAGEIAEAGIEDARIKLELDQGFPPSSSDDQSIFSYSENFFDMDGSTQLGQYSVTIDTTYRSYPYYVIKITSIGTAGPLDAPLARRVICEELDVSPWQSRVDPLYMNQVPAQNPYYFRSVNRSDSGSI